MSANHEIKKLALMVPCPKCQAQVDEQCVTKSNKPMQRPHAARSEPLRLAYLAGRHAAELEL
jgi:hypothetical protein